ncbi:MAG: 5-(carboxyamino)imidazole ribonucleotide synthase [Cytophagaceae bacterium]|nr:5-(carboxyamino)imidazole ribonucleotide synthase [Cytophagaceae bacterium]MDW8456668.1 5-(carboxyamino)imidazole ribonucleotide synthase [Cytophagaceae bacterium]
MYKPGLKLGILGGGQLGRMLIQAAADLDIETHVLDPDDDAPCKNFSTSFTKGSLTDYDSVYNFGKNMDVLTIEIENVNTDALFNLQEKGIHVFPQPHVVATIQDKRTQKKFFTENNIPSADFVLTDNIEDVKKNIEFLPAFHKLGKSGYDGKGVIRLKDETDLHKAFDAPALLEKYIDVEKEISVIVARSMQGKVVAYPPVELVFHPEYNLVDYLLAPAQIENTIAQQATEIAVRTIRELNMVGILAVEMFLTKKGEILVNELAPRPHNSGHHTIEANVTSQFQQHLRAILGLPLGVASTTFNAAMINLLGAPNEFGPVCYEGLENILQMEGVYLHLYGKKITKPFRKMGHITIVGNNFSLLHYKISEVKKKLKVISSGQNS